MAYYHKLITQKSWQELQKLNQEVKFVLIGGWAVYLYSKQLKSKDIDIITDFDQLSTLEQEYSLTKNDRLKKYEAVKEEIQIDIYLPHYSNLGIPVENLISQQRNLKGFRVLEINYLFVLKLYVLARRGRSPKGRKDFLDLVSLWQTEQIKPGLVMEIVNKYKLNTDLENFRIFVNESLELPEFGLTRHQYAKLKKDIFQEFAWE